MKNLIDNGEFFTRKGGGKGRERGGLGVQMRFELLSPRGFPEKETERSKGFHNSRIKAYSDCNNKKIIIRKRKNQSSFGHEVTVFFSLFQ